MSTLTVAVLGASADRSKYGNKSVRAHLRQGYEVFPVNPKGGEIEGLKVYRNLTEVLAKIEGPLDRVTVYLQPDVALTLLDEIAAAQPKEFWLNPGSDREDVEVRARELGLEPIIACSILDVGESPADL